MKEIYTIGLFKNDVLIDQHKPMEKETAICTAKWNNRFKVGEGVWKVMKFGRAVVDRSLEVNDD